MHSLKRHTARESNRVLGLTGTAFWQDESYDCVVRDKHEFERIAAYIERNPVAAALARDPAEFRWSSAWKFGKL
jgi:REP-associated tyrosine transposase